MKRVFAIVAVVATTSLSCMLISWSSPVPHDGSGKGDIFIYEFHEPLHCANTNYKITVTASMVYLVIDAFLNIMYRDSLVLSAKQYRNFVQTLTTLNITNRQPTEGPCVGSASQYFELYAGSSKQLKGIYSACSPGFSNLAGDLAGAAALFEALIPDLEKKIDQVKEKIGDGLCIR